MYSNHKLAACLFGLFVFLGMTSLGFQLSHSYLVGKSYERTVTVKGLATQEYPANIVIWPIQFTAASNNLSDLYDSIERSNQQIQNFLLKNHLKPDEISLSAPSITDKFAQQYGSNNKPEFRYTAEQTVTVYSEHIEKVRALMNRLSELGKQGIAFSGDQYNSKPEYLFTQLNSVKPKMIEQATKNARQTAQKFASDSKSSLGKIKRASQGQFSIQARDRNNPQIKKVRIVSTVEYYLTD